MRDFFPKSGGSGRKPKRGAAFRVAIGAIFAAFYLLSIGCGLALFSRPYDPGARIPVPERGFCWFGGCPDGQQQKPAVTW